MKPDLLHNQLKLYHITHYQSQDCVPVLDKISINQRTRIKCIDGQLQASEDPTLSASETTSGCDVQYLTTTRRILIQRSIEFLLLSKEGSDKWITAKELEYS